MTLRHLALPPDAAPEDLPAAAVAAILERGDLADWAPLAAAVAADPDGPLADTVARLIDAYPMYGTSPLWRAWLDRRRALGSARPASLADVRRAAGLTQKELADRIGMSQSDLSKLERRRDVRVSSLEAYADALGGSLRLVIDLDGRSITVGLGRRQHRPAAR